MAKMFEVRKQQLLRAPKPEVFGFFCRPENLEKLTPPFLNFKIITPSPIPMHAGSLIDYQLSLYGIPFRWRTQIVDFDQGGRFVDKQIKGPYKLWEHTHTFEPVGGATLMTDVVRYQVPFGVLGQMAHPLLVKRSLDEIFNYRCKVADDIFNS